MARGNPLYSKRYQFKLIFGLPFVNIILILALGIFSLRALAATERYYFEATGLGLSLPRRGLASYHNFILILIFFTVLTSIVTALFVIAIFRPLHRIIVLAKEVSGGDLTKRAKIIKTNDEMELLTNVINNMLDSIADLNQKITRERSLVYLGTLVSGLAHEIRNPIASIKTLAELIETAPDRLGKKAEYFQTIHREIDKLDRLIRRLFTFSQPAKSKRSQVQPNELVEELCEDIEKNLKFNRVRIIKRLSPNIPPIFINRGELHQILSNLALNALEAVDYTGEIIISSCKACPPFRFQKLFGKPFSEEDTGEFIEISIQDNGPGFDVNDFEELLEPFYTTKQDGTGLGLAVVKKIVENYDGKIAVSSQMGKGTIFYVYLPIEQRKKRA